MIDTAYMIVEKGKTLNVEEAVGMPLRSCTFLSDYCEGYVLVGIEEFVSGKQENKVEFRTAGSVSRKGERRVTSTFMLKSHFVEMEGRQS